MRHDGAVSDADRPTAAARRATPRPEERVRRLLHPHRRTVVRVLVATVVVIAVLATVGGAIRSLRADGRAPIDPADVDRLQADLIADLGSGAVRGSPPTGRPVREHRRRHDEDRPGLCVRVALGGRHAVDAGLLGLPLLEPVLGRTLRNGPARRGRRRPAVGADALDGRVFTGSSSGLVYAFATDCATPSCEPEWAGEAGEGVVSQPAVNDDFVYVTSDRLYAFPSGCGTDDRICSPAWSADIPGRPSAGRARPRRRRGRGHVVGSGRQRLRVPGGLLGAVPAAVDRRAHRVSPAVPPCGRHRLRDRRGQLLAFPASCEATCSAPVDGTFTATTTVGAGSASSAPSAVGRPRRIVGGQGGTLWVFPATCEEPTCDPCDRSTSRRPRCCVPSSRDGVVYVATIDGTLYAVIRRLQPGAGARAIDRGRVAVGRDRRRRLAGHRRGPRATR